MKANILHQPGITANNTLLAALLCIPIFLVFLCVFFPSTLYAETLKPDETTRYVIESIDVEVNGRTKEYFLLKELEMDRGEIIIGKSDFKAYIADKQQLLINQRPLNEESLLDYSLVPKGDNRYAVHLKIHAEDSWNFISLPYFRYDSNDGLLLSIRTRDYNFFGTLQTLSLNLNYEREAFIGDDSGEYEVEVDFSLPFHGFSRDWVWGQQLGITYIEGIDGEDGWYIKSGLRLGTSFETPLFLGPLGKVRYEPSVFNETNNKPSSRISEGRRGVESGFSQSLSAGRINLIGNFRDGQMVSLSNTNAYNWYEDHWPITLSGEAQFHRTFGLAGLSSRLQGFKTFHSDRKEPGGPLRGILDKRVADSDAGAYMNIDFPFKMWIWFMSRWFEAHLSPFFDAAAVNPSDRSFDPNEDIWYSAGLEAFSFAKFSRALYLRISLGVDLEAFLGDYRITGDSPRDGKSRYAVFIGLGHHY